MTPDPAFCDDRLAHWAEVKPDETCLEYLGRSWTWSQWNDRVRRAAGALADLGIARGDVVAFLDKNHPAGVEISLGAGLLGAATAIVNFRLAGDELDYVINDSGAQVLVVGTELMPQIEKIRSLLAGVRAVIEVTPSGEDDEYEALLEKATPIGRQPGTSPEDTYLVLYSSGTTRSEEHTSELQSH